MQTAILLCATKLLPGVIISNSDCDAFKHQRNLANNIGGCEGRWGKTSMVITNFNLRRSQVSRRGEGVGLNRSSIYIHPPPAATPFFIWLSSNQIRKMGRIHLHGCLSLNTRIVLSGVRGLESWHRGRTYWLRCFVVIFNAYR